MNTIISPSLLACDFLNIEEEIKSFPNQKDLWFHLDIMDGHFVPNLTFGHPVIEKISKVSDYPLDAHLMVNNPEFYINTFKNFNLHNFTFHFEAAEDSKYIISKAKDNFPSVGISLKPNSPVSCLKDDILKNLDLILIMSVEPGFGGQKFLQDSLEKVQFFNELKIQKGFNYMIQVDGGINQENAPLLIEKGANNLVAGSYIFKNPKKDYPAKVASLRS
ncbi:MAG: ribulose-phosphate 3-epimerase [Halobacteriovoraceae bacterium]|nr:ribulose-phosphate 3-epimerase [Halobacteriovoraceae bacterium]|tara:strand:+ start:2776 stop:3432 length:657 start_codon:yes stop_codon:yes gene_type:complete